MNEQHEAVIAAFREFVADQEAGNWVSLGEHRPGVWRLTLDGHIDLPPALAEPLLAYLEANAA